MEGKSTLGARLRDERWALGRVARRDGCGREVAGLVCGGRLMQPVVDAREKGVLVLCGGILAGSGRADEDERAGMAILASIAAIALAIPSPPRFLWRRRICVASSKRVSIFGRFEVVLSSWWDGAFGGEGR